MGKGQKAGNVKKKKTKQNRRADRADRCTGVGEREAEPGDMPLMPPIRPPAMN